METTTATQAQQPAARRFDLGNLGLAAFVVLLIVSFSLASPHFLTFGNITNMLLTVSVIGVMAAVSTLVIVGRELDLSVGSVAALVGVVVAILVESKGWSWPAGIAAGVVVGAATGAFNGFMVASLKVNSIITTIGTLALFRGIAFIVTDGQMAMVQNEGDAGVRFRPPPRRTVLGLDPDRRVRGRAFFPRRAHRGGTLDLRHRREPACRVAFRPQPERSCASGCSW